MKFNDENNKQYNLIKSDIKLHCSVCNEETNYVDYWSENKFCSLECKDKYYNWIKENKDLVL